MTEHRKDKTMNITIRKAKVEDSHAIVTAEQEIAQTPGYFCSQPSELSEQNVIKTINVLGESENGIYLVLRPYLILGLHLSKRQDNIQCS